MRIDVSYNIYLLNNPQKYQKSWKNRKNSMKKWRFCHARHETVSHGSSKAYQFITIKLRRFWHHRDLCNRVKKWSNRDDRDTHTHRHRHTDTRTPNFLLLYRVQGPQKRPEKSWKEGAQNFFFRMNSILRHSNASRSNRRLTSFL
jgi:hypothetical protein